MSEPITQNVQFVKFVDFYLTTFRPIYADTIAFLADKPMQTLIEMENTFTHLMQSLVSDDLSDVQVENINKAYNHLVRATLDCYKMMWVEMDNQIALFLDKTSNGHLAVNLEYSDAVSTWKKFKESAREARRAEMTGVGISPLDAISKYGSTIEIGWQILAKCDRAKLKQVKSNNFISIIKQHGLGFLLGICASLVATYLWEYKKEVSAALKTIVSAFLS